MPGKITTRQIPLIDVAHRYRPARMVNAWMCRLPHYRSSKPVRKDSTPWMNVPQQSRTPSVVFQLSL
jgi:hypothetical protein